MYKYAIYDVTTGDCVSAFVVEQYLGEEADVEVKLIDEVNDEETDRKFGISFDDFTTVSKLTAKGCSLSQIQHIMRQQRNFQTKH